MQKSNSLAFSRFRKFIVMAVAALSMISLTTSTVPAEAKVIRETVQLAGKGINTPAYTWADNEAKPQAILLTIHGGIQHAGVFGAIAQKLAPSGFLVYSIDLRGHGEWLMQGNKRPGVDYNASSEDVIAIVAELRKQHPGLPVFAMGESLGAAITLHAITTQAGLFDGIILASPGTSPSSNHSWSALANSVKQAVGSLGTSIDVSPHLKRISEDERSCDEMIADPRNRKVSSVGDLLKAATFVRKNQSLAPQVDPSVPVLVLQGTEDGICSPKSVSKLFTRFRAQDKTLKQFPGVGHLLVTTEYLKPEVVTTVTDWLSAHMPPVGAPKITSKME